MKKTIPVISVLMSVFNCEDTLDKSIECLLAQTENRWNCIICDDGSTDQSFVIMKKWKERYPEKFILLQNKKNKGLSYSLNRCLENVESEFVARMDGDDLCSPNRFKEELGFLLTHPELDIVSSDMQCFDSNGVWGVKAYPTKPNENDLVHGTPFCHAGCMVRTSALFNADGYSESDEYARVEDYDLWVRMYALGFRGQNIHKSLYQMRDDRNAASRRKWKYRINEARVRIDAVKRLNLPRWKMIFAFRPLILGLLPGKMSAFLHRIKLKWEKE
ncbi:MAG: glycosyltransferase [Anaerolineaceae bacterium]|nr:glycosyltransferase [Anaerolineaceae bacterium]